MTWILLALAFLMLNKPNSPLSALGLDGGIGDILAAFGGTSKGEDSKKGKAGLILDLLSNPMVVELLKNLVFKQDEDVQSDDFEKTDNYEEGETTYQEQENEEKVEESTQDQSVNQDTEDAKTEDAREFFAPVDSVVTPEISKELYSLYDNWYIGGVHTK